MAENLRVKLDEFSDAVGKLLSEYGDEIITASREAMDPVMTEAQKRVKAASPKKTGRYRKSWKKKVEKTRFGSTGVVYASSPYYRLNHLIEHGHALVKGGRKAGRVKGITHIAPVNEWAQEQYERSIIKKVQG